MQNSTLSILAAHLAANEPTKIMPEAANKPQVSASLQRNYRQLGTGTLFNAALLEIPGNTRSEKKTWLKHMKKKLKGAKPPQ